MPSHPQDSTMGQKPENEPQFQEVRLAPQEFPSPTPGHRPGPTPPSIGLPRPAQTERGDATDRRGRRERNGGGLTFPFTPRNADYVARRAMFDASVSIERASSRQADAQEETNVILEKAISHLPDRDQIRTEIARQFEPVVQELKIIGKRIAALDHDEVDHVVALVAAAVETSGKIVNNNNGGQWIINAWGVCKQKPPEPSICDIAILKGKPAIAGRFVAALLGTADKFPGIAQKMSEEDLHRFIRLSQGLCDVIAAPVPTPTPADPPRDTKDPPAPG